MVIINKKYKKDEKMWMFGLASIPACLCLIQLGAQAHNIICLKWWHYFQSTSAPGINYHNGCLCQYHTIFSHHIYTHSAVHLLRSSLNPPSHDPPTISGLESRVSPPIVSLWEPTPPQNELTQCREKGKKREGEVHTDRKHPQRQWVIMESVQ